VQIILLIVTLFMIGFAARRVISEPASLVKWLNNFIVYLAMPALILLNIPKLELSADMLIPVGVAWAWLLIGAATVIALSRWLAWPRQTEAAMLLLVTMGNTSFLGFPMVLAFFSDSVLAYAIFFDQLGGFLILSTFGLIVIAVYSPLDSGRAGRVQLNQIIRKISTFPPFIALVVAVFVPLDAVVFWLGDALTLLSKLLMPVALFLLGVQFKPRLLPEHKVPLFCAIALKMIAAPLLAFFILLSLGSTGDVRTATIFEAAMPSMVTPGLMAMQAGIAPRFIATLLGYSTLFAFVSLPLVAWLLTI